MVLQLHMVHYDKEKAPSLKEAVPKHNGLAVLGTLFEVEFSIHRLFQKKLSPRSDPCFYLDFT